MQVLFYMEMQPQVATLCTLLKMLDQHGIAAPVLRAAPDSPGGVIVAPHLCGRVLAAGFDFDEPTHLYLNYGQIAEGFTRNGRDGWNNFGGTERIWLAPEGGPHALMFDPGPQTYDRYRFQASHHLVPFQLDHHELRHATFSARLEPITRGGTRLSVDISRRVELLEQSPCAQAAAGHCEMIGFESRTTATNAGAAPWSWENGLPALWTIGQYLCRPRVVILVPLRPGSDAELGPRVCTEYFKHLCPGGVMPDDAWRLLPDLLMLKGNGAVQTKIDVWRRRSLGRLASVDLDRNLITLVEFEQPEEQPYLSSYWLPYAGDQHDGASISVFSLSGPPAEGDDAPFYELESFSPALTLAPGESSEHVTRTCFIRGAAPELDAILSAHFNCTLNQLASFIDA